MLSGISVVGPNAGGTPDTFVHGEHGLHYEANNEEAGAEALIEVLRAGPSMRRSVRQHALQYSWEESLRELESYYYEVAKACGILTEELIEKNIR